MTDVRQPAIFIPHGGGPCFWMESPPPFGPHAWDGLRDYRKRHGDRTYQIARRPVAS
jgi:hypothetical protein